MSIDTNGTYSTGHLVAIPYRSLYCWPCVAALPTDRSLTQAQPRYLTDSTPIGVEIVSALHYMSQKNALQAEFTTVMDSTELPLTNPSDCDEVLILKKKLAETEEKLVKFKKFVVNLRNERTQLQDKVLFTK